MTSHNRVVQTVKEYFETLPLGMNKAIDTEEPIQFGANVGGFADVVLRANSCYVAIAECKNSWDSKESAKAQLKSYLCATGTLFGILAIGRATENWIFCENRGSYYFKEITKETFEVEVSRWTPANSVEDREDTARQWENTAREIQKSIRKWQYIAGSLAVVLGISIAVLITLSVMLLGKAPPAAFPLLSEMTTIRAGEFQMGSNDTDADDDEQPVHTVYLDTFYIDLHEVTNAQYKQFVDTNPQWGKERIPSEYQDGDYLKHWEGNNYPQGKENHPVVYISWYAAMAYADWAGRRLPTEAEWEKAARGRLVDQAYPWGNSIDQSKANYSSEIGDTTPVGNYPANAYGLYDMAGNAWEWCLDLYETDFYSLSPRRNPIAGESLTEITERYPTVKGPRVLRSGYWDNPPVFVRVADRYKRSPDSTHRGSGFRCAMSLTH